VRKVERVSGIRERERERERERWRKVERVRGRRESVVGQLDISQCIPIIS
jgi:hypothetical protein